jgi:integrase
VVMKKGENYNRPKPGDQTKVEPIRELKDVKAIKKMLNGNPLYQALFTIGINTNLRAGDLLQIKAGQVQNIKPMDEIELREQKTGKNRRISLNKACVEVIIKLLASRPYQDEEPLFIGQRGRLTVPSVHRLIKTWCGATS